MLNDILLTLFSAQKKEGEAFLYGHTINLPSKINIMD